MLFAVLAVNNGTQPIYVSHIFTSSITRSRIDNDESTVDCIRFSMLACLSINISNVA